MKERKGIRMRRALSIVVRTRRLNGTHGVVAATFITTYDDGFIDVKTAKTKDVHTWRDYEAFVLENIAEDVSTFPWSSRAERALVFDEEVEYKEWGGDRAGVPFRFFEKKERMSGRGGFRL